jgi:hypothetical protein
MLGLTKMQVVVGVTLVRSFSFVIPAILCAILLSTAILAFIQKKLYLEETEVISTLPILYATGLGLMLPIVCSIMPMLDGLKLSLVESLSAARASVKTLYITILTSNLQRRAKLLPYLAFGLITILYGVSVYYLLPLALLSMNLGLLLQIFFVILIALFQGLIMLAINLYNPVCHIFSKLLYIERQRGVR